MRMLVIVLSLLVMSSTRADAESESLNWLIGPVFGIRLGGHPGPRGVFGVEGGFGSGPQRVNLGFEHRDGKLFGYFELDPWLLLGGSFGLGIDSDGEPQPVLGVWEGAPLGLGDCGDRERYTGLATIAAGYRYTGIHELYVTIKAGKSQPFACLDGF